MSEINKEKLMSDIKTVLADAEDLLKQAASSTGDRAAELREKAMSRLKQAKERQPTSRSSWSRKARRPRARPTTTCMSIRGPRSVSRPASAC